MMNCMGINLISVLFTSFILFLLYILYSHHHNVFMYCKLIIKKLTSNLCSYILQCYFSLTRSQCSLHIYGTPYHDTTPPHTYVGFTTNIYRVMYRVRFAVCTVFVLRCLELAILPGWWVENPQQRLMSPHREPSPVHYVTKSPVIAAYLLGRRCRWARENLSWDNRRVKILVCELLWYLYFLREPVPISIFTYPRPKLDPFANKFVITLVFGAWMWKFENQ